MSRRILVVLLIVAVALVFFGVANYQGWLPWKISIAVTKKPVKKPAKKSKKRPARRSYAPSVPEVPQIPAVPCVPAVPRVPAAPSVPGVPAPPMAPQTPAVPDITHVPRERAIGKVSISAPLVEASGPEKTWRTSGFLNGGKTRVEKTGASVSSEADVFFGKDDSGMLHAWTVFNGIKTRAGETYPE